MSSLVYLDNFLSDLLKPSKTIALVGASKKPERDSYEVMEFLLHRGFDVYPVNPTIAGETVLGKTVYASLKDIPVSIDIVDLFVNSERVKGIVDETLSLSPLPKGIWMQLGVRDDESAAKAEEKGIKVIMDRCILIETKRLNIIPIKS